MARDLICPACGKFGFKTTDVFVTGESASLKCVLCGEWSAQPKWKTVAMLIAEVERLQTEFNKAAQIIITAAESSAVQEKLGRDLLDENVRLRDSLTRSKAEGRREGMEEAAKIAHDRLMTMGYPLRADDVAAAIRQQAGLEGDGPTKDQETIIHLEADLGVAKEKLKQIDAIVDNAPELNMSNYDVDQVAALNAAMIEIYNVLVSDEAGEQI